MLHLPILRAGKPYRSLDHAQITDVVTGEPVARVSQANRGLIARDLNAASAHRESLARRSMAELLEICRKAADLFVGGELPVDPVDGVMQSPDDYVRTLSATTGMPHALCRGNMEKIRFVLAEMETVLAGLTRGLDLGALDAGWTEQDGRTVSYLGQADALGAVLPNNSPGVHSLWIPSIALKVPLALKPGRLEPWTPMRILQALAAAGCPEEALGFYPADYGGAAEILMRCDRSMIFGDEATVRPWKQDTRVQLHGPGWSKVLLGRDRAGAWESYLDLMQDSIAINGGRSCVNASGVWVPAHGRKVAEALARRLAKIEAKPLDDPEACIAAFPDPEMAQRMSELVDNQLEQPGAVDLTAEFRGAGRVAEVGGCTFLLPTVIWCDDPGHALTRTELLFPFATVVEVPQDEMLSRIGPTLVATALTEDPVFRRQLMTARSIDRLNLGEFPTSHVSWDQPHEGNLFDHLYRQRAFQGGRADHSAA